MKKLKIEGGFVIIGDEELAKRLRSLGGGVEAAAGTKMMLLEAAYFAEKGVLPLKKEKLLKETGKKDKLAKEKYEVLKYLRDNGYITRPSLDNSPYLRLHRKGFRPGEDRTYYLVKVVEKNWKADVVGLMKELQFAGRLRKELVIAVPGKERPAFIKFGRSSFE